ncbi:hypothetical protein NDU88_008621, partial [Pleurodeles waltl]
ECGPRQKASFLSSQQHRAERVIGSIMGLLNSDVDADVVEVSCKNARRNFSA